MLERIVVHRGQGQTELEDPGAGEGLILEELDHLEGGLLAFLRPTVAEGPCLAPIWGRGCKVFWELQWSDSGAGRC